MFKEFRLAGGVQTDETRLAAQGFPYRANFMRSVRQRAEPWPGCEKATLQSFSDIIRGATSWTNLIGDELYAGGSATALELCDGGAIRDITPLAAQGYRDGGIATRNGKPEVQIFIPFHGLVDDDVITISNVDTVAGLDLNGNHTVKFLTGNSIQITAGSNANADIDDGGGVWEYSAPLQDGRTNGLGGRGYGIGPYGEGLFGVGAVGDIDPTHWFTERWGNDLIALRNKRGLYQFHHRDTYDNLLTDVADWESGTNWVISSGTATASAATHEQAIFYNITGDVEPGVTHEVTFTVSGLSGALRVNMESLTGIGTETPTTTNTQIGPDITKNGTFTRRFVAPANASRLNFTGSAAGAFSGSINLNTVDIRVEDKAFRVVGAPPFSRCMGVHPNGFVFLGGTTDIEGNYNPLHIRWCDQSNIQNWIPGEGSAAGFATLDAGDYIVGMVASRDAMFVWTNTTLYRLSYTGQADDAFEITPVSNSKGLIGPHAACSVDGRVYWWGNDKQFYEFSAGGYVQGTGGEPTPIDCGFRNEIMDNLALGQNFKIWCAPNSESTEILWGYADTRDGLECSRIAAFNYIEKHWWPTELARSFWIPQGVTRDPIAFGINGRPFFHERGNTLDGAPLNWYIESADFDDGQGGDTLFTMRGFKPDFKDQVGNILFSLTTRKEPHGGIWQSKGPYTVGPTTTNVKFSAKGRSMGFRLEGQSADSFARMGVLRFDVKTTGQRN